METTRLCPQCQQPLTADAPSGLCPQCLLKAAADPPPSASGVGLAGDIIDIGDPAEVAKKLPQFEILEMLGRGGMGVVYKARQPQLDRVVALKILPPIDALSPDFVARFTREARALAKLNHPNIVNVYDFGESGGLYYIIMEFVDGMNLRQLLQTRRLTPAEALAIVPKICDALEYAHEEGIVHRDIKPENLLLDKKGRVKIADFGLAKLLRREPLDMTLTLSGMALGTLRYMAPEQMDKPETVDHRADLYSLGVVIYEMLTGETPVGRFELPSQKAQVDVRLDNIVLHALEKEPARRYQHASEVRDDVEKVTSKPQIPPVAAAAASPSSAGGESNDAEGAEQDAEMEHSIFAWAWKIIALAAVILAFFNPWGAKAWYGFAAVCAITGVLASFGIGRRKDVRSQLSTGRKGENRNFQSLRKPIWKTAWGKFILIVSAVAMAVLAGGRVFLRPSAPDLQPSPRHSAHGVITATSIFPATKKPPLPAPDAEGWSSLFDGKSLANWSRHEGFDHIIPSDKFRISDGEIVLPVSTNWSVITIASEFPTANYEVEFEAMQSAGEQVCGVGLSVGDSLSLVTISDNLGSKWLDGHMLIQNDQPVTLAAGQWHKVHIRVAERAEVTVDEVIILEVIVARISGSPLNCEILKPFSLMASQSETRLRNIRVRLLRSLETSTTNQPGEP